MLIRSANLWLSRTDAIARNRGSVRIRLYSLNETLGLDVAIRRAECEPNVNEF